MVCDRPLKAFVTVRTAAYRNMQDQLFYDDFRAALTQAVNALGGCASVGARLWGGKPVKQAEQKLANCLNPNHEWKLDIEEVVSILRWAREAGSHFALHKLCEEAGYEPPDIAPVMTEAQKRARRMRELLNEFTQLADEEAAAQREQLRAIK